VLPHYSAIPCHIRSLEIRTKSPKLGVRTGLQQGFSVIGHPRTMAHGAFESTHDGATVVQRAIKDALAITHRSRFSLITALGAGK